MRVLVTVLFAALVLTSASLAGSGDFELKKVAQTDKTVTFAWKRQSGADGYRFLRNGVVVSRTFNRSTTTATFWKGARYTVEVLRMKAGGQVMRGARASVTADAPKRVSRRHPMKLVFVAAPKVEFKLRLASRTSKTVAFTWKRQPNADGYAFVRNGVVVSRTFDRSTTTATFWKGSRYAVHELRRTPDRKVVSVRRAVVYAKASPGSKKIRLVFVPARKVDFALRLADRTSKTVTFTWKRQPGADGYRFVRNGVVVSRTFNRSTTTATFWKGSRYAVDVLRKTGRGKATPVWRALAYSGSPKNAPATKPAPQPKPSPGASSPPVASPSPTAPPSTSRPSPTTPKPPPTTSTPSPTTPKPPPTTSTPPPPATSPPPPTSAPPSVGPGGTVTLTGSYSPSAFFAAIALAPPGPVTTAGSYSITGDIDVNRPDLRINGATIQGTIEFRSSATGSSLTNSSASGFNVWGADNIVLEGNTFDGRGQVPSNQLWDLPAGNTPDNWVIRNNTFRNFYKDGSHSEAIFVGYSSNGLIEGNTFTNNGNTSHIFFSYWGTAAYEGASPSSTYARNMCVRGNTFNQTAGAYYDVNFRQEIPSNANIKIQRDATNTDPEFYGDC